MMLFLSIVQILLSSALEVRLGYRAQQWRQQFFLEHFINKTHIQEMGVVLLPTFFDA